MAFKNGLCLMEKHDEGWACKSVSRGPLLTGGHSLVVTDT